MKILLRVALVVFACYLPLFAQHRVVESHPLFQQAMEYAANNKFSEAIETIDKLIALKPDESLPLLARATFRKSAGDLASFRKDLDQAAALAPNDISILIGIERTLGTTDGTVNQEGCERVLAFADSHYSKFPESSAILGIRSRMKNCLGDVAGAYNDVSLAIELDPRNASYRMNRSSLLDRFGDPNQALKLLAELIKSLKATISLSKDQEEKTAANRELPSAFNSRARIHERSGDLELAIVDATKAIEVSDEETYLRFRYELFVKMQRFPEAAADISTIIDRRKQKRSLLVGPGIPPDLQNKLERADARLFIARGDIYVHVGKYDDAIADYARSSKLDPSTKDESEKKTAIAAEKKATSPN